MKPSQYKRLSVLKERRKIQFSRAALTGFVAGCVAVAFQLALELAEHLREHWLEYTQEIGDSSGFMLFVVSVGLVCALSAFITVRFAPETTGSGIPHTKAVLLYLRPLRWVRIILVKFIAGVMAIGSGLSLGREGPTIQLSAAVGGGIGKLMKVPRRSRMHLIACGAGAGLSAAFNAPLAGFIFVIEELRKELSPVTYGTALIATVVADIVTRSTIGNSPAFSLPEFIVPPLETLPLIAIAGVIAGLLGVLFNRLLTRSVEVVPKIRKYFNRGARAILIGMTVASIGWFLPDALGPGNHVVEKFITSDSLISMSVYPILLLLFVKFTLTILSYCAGVPGGIFAPLLVQGALLGIAIGKIECLVFPQMYDYMNSMGVIVMAAYFSAIVRAPLTGVVLIIEMTANYNLLFPLLVASLSSYLVAEAFKEKPIYESLLLLNLKLRAPRDTLSEEPVIIDIVVESGSEMEGKKIKNISIPKGCLIISHSHGGEEHIPNGEDKLQVGDELTIIIEGDRSTIAHQIKEKASAKWDAQ